MQFCVHQPELGRTPLQIATLKEYREVASVLKQAGAAEIVQQKLKDLSGKTSLMFFLDEVPSQFQANVEEIRKMQQQELSRIHQIATTQKQGLLDTQVEPVQRPWKTIRLFLSSTFGKSRLWMHHLKKIPADMHSEREYLIKNVIPNLRKMCAERRLHLVEVDLRWGVTEEEAKSGKVLDLCLSEVDKYSCDFIQVTNWTGATYSVECSATDTVGFQTSIRMCQMK